MVRSNFTRIDLRLFPIAQARQHLPVSTHISQVFSFHLPLTLVEPSQPDILYPHISCDLSLYSTAALLDYNP